MTETNSSPATDPPTGPEITGPETLRRTVPLGGLREDGSLSSSAFQAASHDTMMSTLRERVTPQQALERWRGKHPPIGVWPVRVEDSDVAETGLRAYDDGEKPCACEGNVSDCEGPYPADHASVDMRATGRSRREKLAKKLRDAAAGEGALLLVPTD